MLKKEHKEFADMYLQTDNQTEAYYVAYNYKPEQRDTATVNASKLMARQDIKDYIEAERAKALNKNNVSKDELIEKHLRVVRMFDNIMLLLEKDVLTKEEEEKLKRYQKFFRSSSYKEALEQIGKLQSMYANQIDIGGTVKVITIKYPDQPIVDDSDDDESDIADDLTISDESDIVDEN
jgi:phage terminase small subunit